MISGPTELKTLTDAIGCGKRNTRENAESPLAECLWNCEVKIKKIAMARNIHTQEQKKIILQSIRETYIMCPRPRA